MYLALVLCLAVSRASLSLVVDLAESELIKPMSQLEQRFSKKKYHTSCTTHRMTVACVETNVVVTQLEAKGDELTSTTNVNCNYRYVILC